MEKQIILKHTAKKHFKVYSCYEKIKEQIEKIPKLEDLKNDRELLNCVCNLFEDNVNTKKYNVNKKELVLQLYSEIFNDTSEEYLKKVSDDIEYLFNHGNIKKSSLYKKFLRTTWNLVKNIFFLLIR